MSATFSSAEALRLIETVDQLLAERAEVRAALDALRPGFGDVRSGLTKIHQLLTDD